MASQISRTQIDKLGERLATGTVTEDDLRLLDAYRRSFSPSYEETVHIIRGELGLQLTGRPAKSTSSITEKLRRETIRLSQMQDIAGCRLVVADLAAQEEVVASLELALTSVTKVDRRSHPSHGYRAIHLVASRANKYIEVQVRTALQHLWAELSEKLSDVLDPGIKYGGGSDQARKVLADLSEAIADVEDVEARYLTIEPNVGPSTDSETASRIKEQLERVRGTKSNMRKSLEDAILALSRFRESN